MVHPSLPFVLTAVALFAFVACGSADETTSTDDASEAGTTDGGVPDATSPSSPLESDAATTDGGRDAATASDATTTDADAPLDGGADALASDASDSGAADAADAPLEPATTVRFVALGDQGKGCASATDGQCKVAAAMEAKCAASGCDFGVLLGDNIYQAGAPSANDPIFQTIFEQPYANLAFPFYVALGNHDCGGDGAGTNFGRCESEIGYTQLSQKWKLPARHYHQKFGGRTLELFVADTNASMVGAASSVLVEDAPLFEAQDNAQRADLAKWMAASTAAWKIAMGHHPKISNGPHGNAGKYDCKEVLGSCVAPPAPINGKGVERFLNDVVCGKVDLYLSGHDHSRQWPLDTCNGTELIVSGGGASTDSLPRSNPMHFAKATLGFVYVVVSEKTLTAEFIDESGNVEFSRTLTKP